LDQNKRMCASLVDVRSIPGGGGTVLRRVIDRGETFGSTRCASRQSPTSAGEATRPPRSGRDGVGGGGTSGEPPEIKCEKELGSKTAPKTTLKKSGRASGETNLHMEDLPSNSGNKVGASVSGFKRKKQKGGEYRRGCWVKNGQKGYINCLRGSEP